MSRHAIVLSILLCLLCAVHTAPAQGSYLTIGLGYALGSGTQILGAAQGPTSTEGVYGSLGEGLKVNLAGGHMFTKSVGGELGLSYWSGNSFEWTSDEGSSRIKRSVSGSGFIFIPGVVFSTEMQPVAPYGRAGLILGILKVTDELTSSDGYAATVEETGGVAWGYQGAFGLLVSTGGLADFFAELTITSVTYSPSQTELTKLTYGGQDMLGQVANKTITLEESVPNGSEDKDLAVRRPFSSIGLAMGVRIPF